MSDIERDPPRLEQLQRWMFAVITNPLGVESGVAAEAASDRPFCDPARLDTVVRPGPQQSSADRLAVYANAYFARLLECMRKSFPMLTDALGEELFNEFAFGYLQRYPSRTYTLNRLADDFVKYLRESRPTSETREGDGREGDSRDGDGREGDGQESDAKHCGAPDWTDFIIDLATLEAAFDEVFDGPGMESDPQDGESSLQSVSPEQWAETRLTPAPCLRLVQLQYPVNRYYTAWRNNESPSPPQPQPCYLAVTRRDYIVRRHELDAREFQTLSALVAGRTVGEVMGGLLDGADDVEALAATIGEWFRAWSANGFFHGFRSFRGDGA